MAEVSAPEADPAEELFDSEELDLTAKIIADEAPDDLFWSIPQPLPDGWEVEDFPEERVAQVTVSPHCIIQFHQSVGHADPDSPDSAEVARDFTLELGQEAFHTEVTVEGEQPVMLGAFVNDGALEAQFSFAKASFAAEAEPQLGGTTYAYRAGTYALIAFAACGDHEYPKQGEDMRAFIENSRASVTFASEE
ncbi:hypothetical protein [Leucobacter aridicollis]|uniref:hypothetical protein n=1 Tax=Leucobacter aridicollis TaxID=283878 RepID=UPI002105AEE2|nr:hypothetical protein [Leucobacter aridicollis]UTX52866.1 hypothetical protein KI794_14285 [Leucobacter aridicollis]